MLIRRNSRFQSLLYIVICFLLVQELVFFQHGFWCYHLCPSAWEKQEVKVLAQEVKDRSLSRGSHYYIKKGEVTYQYQGIEYKTKVLMSEYESIGDVINIAVCKNNKDIVIRYDFLEIDSWSIIFYFIILIVLEVLKWRKGKKGDHVITITTSDYQKTTDTSQQEKEFRKYCIWQYMQIVFLALWIIVLIIRVYIEDFAY